MSEKIRRLLEVKDYIIVRVITKSLRMERTYNKNGIGMTDGPRDVWAGNHPFTEPKIVRAETGSSASRRLSRRLGTVWKERSGWTQNRQPAGEV